MKSSDVLSFEKNNTQVKVFSLSQSRKLFFQDYNKTLTNIYAVKIMNVRGKDVYKLVDIGFLKKDLEEEKKDKK